MTKENRARKQRLVRSLKSADEKENFLVSAQGTQKTVGSSFYRGETLNPNPYHADFSSPTFLEDFILKGWMPGAPILARKTAITAFGSCFAGHITRHLAGIGYKLSREREPSIYISKMGEGLVNTYALLGQFEWALENKKQPVDLWHGFEADGYGYDEDIRLRTREVLLNTEFFILTLGLSEIWYDEITGGVFWRAVPLSAFDPSRHRFRVSTVAETRANLAAIYGLIRKHVPQAKVLFTLSPVSLAATFRPIGCISANTVSKAVLRAGLDELIRERLQDLNDTLFYFPSFEIVHSAFADPWVEDKRHPRLDVIETIMTTFEAVYCKGGATLADANRMLQETRARYARGPSGLEPELPRSQVKAARKARRKAGKAARRVARTLGSGVEDGTQQS